MTARQDPHRAPKLWHLAIVAVCLLSGAAFLFPGPSNADHAPAAVAPAATDAALAQQIAREPLAALQVDWSRVEAAPDPSPTAIAAYGE